MPILKYSGIVLFLLKTTAFFIGAILICINIAGFFIPLKNPDIYQENKTGFRDDTTLSSKEAFALLESLDKADKKEYVTRVNDIFNRSIAHYWEDEGIKKYNISIPFHENWILASLQYVLPSIYKHYEFCNYKKALERGVGLCSQHAVALVDFLSQNNIEARTIGLDGHVVATAEVKNNEWWVLDADYGVVIPYNITRLQMSPDIIKQYYSGKGMQINTTVIENIAEIYGSEGNIIYPKADIGHVGYIDCNWKKVIIEHVSYILKWLIPILLIIPFLYLIFRKFHV